MDKPARFRRAIAHIEEHLHGQIDLEQTAQAGFMSLMQLYRDFYTYTGHSVKEYIRKRRLSNALNLIRCSGLPLAEIAYTCGYSSQQALCKSVKSATTMTPLEYRKSDTCYYFPQYANTPTRQVAVSAETIPLTIRSRFYYPKLRGIEDQAIDALRKLSPDYTGRIFGRNGSQEGSRFCYELLVEYDPVLLEKLARSVFREVSIQPVRTLLFAKTTVNYQEHEIGPAWNELYGSWLKSSMFTQDDEDYFEEYLHKRGEVKRLVLYVPVRKREDYDKIRLVRYSGGDFLVATATGRQGEEEASRTVMNYLAVHRPESVRTARQFLVSEAAAGWTCGIRLDTAVELPVGSGLRIMHLAEGSYAVLNSSCGSGRGPLEARLTAWISENGLRTRGQPAFHIYETDGGYEPQQLKASCWIMLDLC